MRKSLRRNGPCKATENKRPYLFPLISALPIIVLLFSCSSPARYVIISEDMKDAELRDANQRFVCLMKEDARDNAALLALNTKSAVRDYEQRRKAGLNPVEDVLSRLIQEDYKKAAELLNTYGDRIPAYLKLILKADLASEDKKKDMQDGELVKMYQAAFDVQNSEANREIIKLRIRQLRYGR
jgi:hypothetical protein